MKPLVINQSRDRIPRQWLEKWIKSLSRQLARRRHPGLARKELVVVFVDSHEMKRLNHVYRGRNYATDILSFDSADPNSLGELVLCLPTIRSQARHTGLSARGELGYMIVHGVLHLLGFDHADSKEEKRMFALQDELYNSLEASIGLR